MGDARSSQRLLGPVGPYCDPGSKSLINLSLTKCKSTSFGSANGDYLQQRNTPGFVLASVS